MKLKGLILTLLIFLPGCDEKIIEVTSVDQIPGTWRWESTCGGDTAFICVNASKSNYATVEFKSNGAYIEKHMDTVYLQTNYILIKSDDMFGTLILENPNESRPVTVMNNELIIQRGSFEDNYTKIK
ncbi:MAG: hypothetical protein NT092_05530 [Bacteroidia bacterium]|nr:hypothetical protein [Bacteroidia bacterium]